MLSDEIREKFQHIVRRELQEGQVDPCTATSNLLRTSFGSGPTVKSEFESKTILKEEQASFLTSYAKKKIYGWNLLPPGSQYLTEGREAKVYLAGDGIP